ncbi:MAG: hypothetical protein FWG47_02120, partial [Propionibacteriaceae bacterium]|nr:hypothetical protein [Propionibacteriaceae bacterium]
DEKSKTRLVANVYANAERCRKLDRLRTQRRELVSVEPPSGGRPLFPLMALGAAIVSFFIMIGTFASGASGVGVAFLLVTLVFSIYVGVKISKRSGYDQALTRYEDAQRKLEDVEKKLRANPPLTEPIWLLVK